MSLAWFLPLPGSYAGVDVVGVYNFACSLREVLAKHPFLPHGCGLFSGSYFPSFSEGLSLRALAACWMSSSALYFPSFSEGLSLRDRVHHRPTGSYHRDFPSFSEGLSLRGSRILVLRREAPYFPSFSEGLSLRAQTATTTTRRLTRISLPFRRDFH